MWLSYILGLTGPNGKYFCNNCLVNQQDVAKGIPHSFVILPKYRTTDSDEGETSKFVALKVLNLFDIGFFEPSVMGGGGGGHEGPHHNFAVIALMIMKFWHSCQA